MLLSYPESAFVGTARVLLAFVVLTSYPLQAYAARLSAVNLWQAVDESIRRRRVRTTCHALGAVEVTREAMTPAGSGQAGLEAREAVDDVESREVREPVAAVKGEQGRGEGEGEGIQEGDREGVGEEEEATVTEEGRAAAEAEEAAPEEVAGKAAARKEVAREEAAEKEAAAAATAAAEDDAAEAPAMAASKAERACSASDTTANAAAGAQPSEELVVAVTDEEVAAVLAASAGAEEGEGARSVPQQQPDASAACSSLFVSERVPLLLLAALIGSTLLTALLVRELGIIVELIGASSGCFITLICPGAAYLQLRAPTSKVPGSPAMRLAAAGVLVIGSIMLPTSLVLIFF